MRPNLDHRTVVGAMLLLMILLTWAGCKQQSARSDAFAQIFKEDAGGTLRGVNLGDSLAVAREKEGGEPRHDDQWGYVYEFSLGGKSKYFVEYVCKDPAIRKVNAMVVNVLLEEKAVASDLFSEIESHFRNRYGVAEGGISDLKWRYEEANLMVSLRMLDDKKSISLSYGALEPL